MKVVFYFGILIKFVFDLNKYLNFICYIICMILFLLNCYCYIMGI